MKLQESPVGWHVGTSEIGASAGWLADVPTRLGDQEVATAMRAAWQAGAPRQTRLAARRPDPVLADSSQSSRMTDSVTWLAHAGLPLVEDSLIHVKAAAADCRYFVPHVTSG